MRSRRYIRPKRGDLPVVSDVVRRTLEHKGKCVSTDRWAIAPKSAVTNAAPAAINGAKGKQW